MKEVIIASQESQVIIHWSPWGEEKLITSQMIEHFADITNNHQWVHEPEAQDKPPYGRQIAHGLLLVSLITDLLPKDADTPRDASVRIIRGFDRLRLPSPVYPQDIVHVRMRKLSAYQAQSGKGTVVESEVELWSLTGAKPAVSCLLKLQYF